MLAISPFDLLPFPFWLRAITAFAAFTLRTRTISSFARSLRGWTIATSAWTFGCGAGAISPFATFAFAGTAYITAPLAAHAGHFLSQLSHFGAQLADQSHQLRLLTAWNWATGFAIAGRIGSAIAGTIRIRPAVAIAGSIRPALAVARSAFGPRTVAIPAHFTSTFARPVAITANFTFARFVRIAADVPFAPLTFFCRGLLILLSIHSRRAHAIDGREQREGQAPEQQAGGPEGSRSLRRTTQHTTDPMQQIHFAFSKKSRCQRRSPIDCR
jgi:hypothetical protein